MPWGTPPAHIGGILNDVKGVPVTSLVRETPLNTNREFI